MVVIESVDHLIDDSPLAQEWDDLLSRSPGDKLFRSWEWLSTWWRHFGRERTLEILLTRSQQGTITGILPLFHEQRHPVPGLSLGCLAPLGGIGVGSDYLDLVAAEHDEERAAQSLASHLFERSSWDILDFFDYPAGSSLAHVLGKEARLHDAWTEQGKGFLCPIISLKKNFDDQLDSIVPKVAGNFRTHLKRTGKNPGFSFGVWTKPEEAPQALEAFFRLHGARWSGDYITLALAEKSQFAFHQEVIHRLAHRGWMRFYHLDIGGFPAAVIYGIERDGTFYYYQSGYDLEWKAKSVGTLLLGLSVKDCIERGIHTYDFLRGVENYKLGWAQGSRQTKSLRLVRGVKAKAWLSCRSAMGSLKGTIKRFVRE